MQNNNKKIVFGFVAIFIVAIVWLVTISLSHRNKVPIEIIALPNDSKIKIDGKNTKSGTHYLPHGVHSIEAARTLFETVSIKINTVDFNNKETVYILPKATSSEALKWLEDNPKVQAEREAAGGAEAERQRKVLLKKYPIIQKLPYENYHFRINYSVSDMGEISFQVSLLAIINRPEQYQSYLSQQKSYKEEALNYLRAQNINTGAVKITYNPDIK